MYPEIYEMIPIEILEEIMDEHRVDLTVAIEIYHEEYE
jgi:hypothetical protein